jgi:VIT1/CCC1 family predicted Fe2+/Mn2+ transporter
VKALKSKLQEAYLRSLMFGLQDGIVSTTGVVVGISTGVSDKAIIVLAALVAVTVEATSMAAGQYTSEQAAHQLDKTGSRKDSLFIGTAIMFFAYMAGGMFAIVPTLLFNQPEARFIAIASAFGGLFLIGYLKGYLVEHKPLRSAVELFIIGGIATTIGVIVGYFLKV